MRRRFTVSSLRCASLVALAFVVAALARAGEAPQGDGPIVISEFVAAASERLLTWSDGPLDATVGQGGLPLWNATDFDDTTWNTGPGGLGYGDGDDATVVNIQNVAASLYLRRAFTVTTTDTASTHPLEFDVDYDDGFVAYLNGVEIARRNLGQPGQSIPHDQTTDALHEAVGGGGGPVETVTLTTGTQLLTTATNVLAIQVHNYSFDSSDLTMIADLRLAAPAPVTLVDHGDTWRYFVGESEPRTEVGGFATARLGSGIPWTATAFDDDAWTTRVGAFDDVTHVEAEDYNPGGQYVGYYDTSVGNTGGEYRSDDVDITLNNQGGYRVGWVDNGEWLKYDVTLPADGNYTIAIRTSRGFPGSGQVHFDVDGGSVGGPMIVPDTGGWVNYVMTEEGGIALTAGAHTVTLHADFGPMDIDYFQLVREGPLDLRVPALYVRRAFIADADEAASTAPLRFEVDYGTGFIAWLNGKEIARRNTGGDGGFVYHDQPAYTQHGPGQPETHTLGPASEYLTSGTNVLALQVQSFQENTWGLPGRVFLRADLWTSATTPTQWVHHDDVWRYWMNDTVPPSGGLADEDGEYSDWIEIHNPTTATVSLANWSLSDDDDEPDKWTFPDVSMPGGTRRIVFASGKDRRTTDGAPLHANFKIDRDGEYLALFNDTTTASVFAPECPPQSYFHSYAQFGASDWRYYDEPTPGRPNHSKRIYTNRLEAPEYIPPQGFYDGTIQVTLTTPTTPGALILYTTDGSDPSTQTGTIYTGPITLDETTVLRARVFGPGRLPSPEVHATYLMNRSAVERTLPALSLIGDAGKSFYAPHGVMAIVGDNYPNGWWEPASIDDYNNFMQHGRAWERPVSVGWIEPTDNSGFRLGAGLRAMGSAFNRPHRHPGDKFSLRLYFRGEYGAARLDHPLFDESTVETFEKLSLRAGHNDSSNPFIRDELARTLGRDCGLPGSHGTFANLFINGRFKGYYNPCERIDRDFCQAHFDSDADWDVVHIGEVKDGDSVHWNTINAFFNTTQCTLFSNYLTGAQYVNIEDFIDYLIVQTWGANWDWPTNNWGAFRERSSAGRWTFYLWDCEGWMETWGDFVHVDAFNKNPVYGVNGGSGLNGENTPVANIYRSLKASAEFRLAFADRIQKHFFLDGAMTNAHIQARYEELRDRVQPMVESIAGTFDNTIETVWLPQRRDILFNHFIAEGLWPALQAPEFSHYGGTVPTTFTFTMTNPNVSGEIYYTLDGSDPRTSDTSAISPSAFAYTGPITAPLRDFEARARVRHSTQWSPCQNAAFTIEWPVAQPGDVIVTEMLVNAFGPDEGLEWFEVFNTSDRTLNLDGWLLADNGGNDHTIDADGALAIGPKAHLVLGASDDTFSSGGAHVDYAYGDDLTLGNDGDELILFSSSTLIHSVGYEDFDSTPTPIITVVPNNIQAGVALGMALDYCDAPTNVWMSQTSHYGPTANTGTPGQDNDWVGLCGNDIWPPVLQSARFARGDTVLLIFDEALDPASVADTSHYDLAGLGHPTSATQVADGRILLTFAERPAPETPHTLDVDGVRDLALNSMAPWQGELAYAVPPVVLNEIMYDNLGIDVEWIELYNTTDAMIDLSGWSLSDGPTWPPTTEGHVILSTGTLIEAGEYLVVNLWGAPDFAERWRMHDGIRVVDALVLAADALDDAGDNLALHDTPGDVLVDGSLDVPVPDFSVDGASVEKIDERFGWGDAETAPWNWRAARVGLGFLPGQTPGGQYIASHGSPGRMNDTARPAVVGHWPRFD